MDNYIAVENYIGKEIFNKIYGKGQIIDIEEKDNDYTLKIIFGDPCVQKSFVAWTAFEKDTLRFLSDDNNSMFKLLLLKKHSEKTQNHVNNRIVSHANEISKNDITNVLIASILDNESIALDLISLFDDALYEQDLCNEAFSYLEKCMDGNKLNKAQQACVIVALAFVALKYYDGDLHGHVESKYRQYRIDTEKKYTRTSIQNAVCKILDNEREKVNYFNPNSYVAVPLVLSCVPHYRAKDLYRIAYDIYKRKLLFDEDISDEQIKEKVGET